MFGIDLKYKLICFNHIRMLMKFDWDQFMGGQTRVEGSISIIRWGTQFAISKHSIYEFEDLNWICWFETSPNDKKKEKKHSIQVAVEDVVVEVYKQKCVA